LRSQIRKKLSQGDVAISAHRKYSVKGMGIKPPFSMKKKGLENRDQQRMVLTSSFINNGKTPGSAGATVAV
jgi:hypothetical protein